MTVTAPPPPSGAPAATAAPPAPATQRAREACPLCSAPLHPEQEWCLNCGAAARTRLAASPGWRGPIVTLVVVLVLSLGVLAGSLVKLAGGTPPAATQTTTVTTSAAATPTVPGGLLPGTTATTPTTNTFPHPTQTVRPGASGTGSSSTTTPAITGGFPIHPVKPNLKVKGPIGGVNGERLRKLLAERIRKARPTEK